MNELRIEFENKKDKLYRYPENWDELSDRQLHKLLPLLPKLYTAADNFKKAKGNAALLKIADSHLQHLRIKALYILLDIKWWHLRNRIAMGALYADELTEVLNTIDFILQAPNRVKAPFPYLAKKYVGPDDGLKALTAEEYHFATLKMREIAQQSEAESPNKEALETLMRQLCFIMYRPKGKGPKHNPQHPDYCGDRRSPFNRHSLETLSTKLERVPFWKIQIIVWWFGQLNRKIQQAHPRIFSGSKEKEGNSKGWLTVFRALAKDPLKTQEIGRLRLSFLLFELGESLHESDRINQKFKQWI